MVPCVSVPPDPVNDPKMVSYLRETRVSDCGGPAGAPARWSSWTPVPVAPVIPAVLPAPPGPLACTPVPYRWRAVDPDPAARIGPAPAKGVPEDRDPFIGVSAEILTPAFGATTFTDVTATRKFTAGQPIFAVSRNAPAIYMFGQFISYAGTSLTIDVTNKGTAAPASDWDIFAAGGYQLGDSCVPQGLHRACWSPAGKDTYFQHKDCICDVP